MEITVKEIRPLQPVKIIIEDENGKAFSNIFFMDPNTGDFYNSNCTIDPKVNEKAAEWIQQKEEEMKRKMMGIIAANPEQARAMGIDLSSDADVSPGGIFLGR